MCNPLRVATAHFHVKYSFPAYDDGGAPTIEPSDSFITIDVGSDKAIECSAEKPVTWISEV